MQALMATPIGVLITAALAYDTAHLVTPRESDALPRFGAEAAALPGGRRTRFRRGTRTALGHTPPAADRTEVTGPDTTPKLRGRRSP